MADSPGGVEEGRVSIRVVPDTSKFATDLKADLVKIAAEINFAIKVDLDNSGLDEKAKAAAKEAQAAAGNINIKTNVDNSQIDDLKKSLTGVEGQTNNIGTSMGFWQVLILAAVAAVAIFGPALAVLLPIIAGIGLAVGAIALTMKGLGKVFAPLVDGIKSLTKPLTKTITQGLAPFVKQFTTSFIPVLKAGLTASAQILNQVAKAFLSLGRDSSFMKDLQSFIVGAAIAFRPLVNVIPLVAKAFVQIGVAALPALLALTKGFAGVLIDFSNAITRLAASGQLTKIINNATSALSALLGATTAILGQLLRLGVLLAPTFAAVFNAVGPLAKIVDTQLVGAFKTLQPVLQAVFNFLSQNQTLLAGLAVALAAIVAPTLLVAAAIVVLLANFKTVQPVLVGVFQTIVAATIPLQQAFASVVTSAQGLFAVLAPIVSQIVAIFVQNWPQIRTIVVQVFSTIQSIVVAVLTAISTQIKIDTAVIGFLWKEFGGIILSTIQTVFPAILTIIQGVLNVIQGVFRLFTDVLKGNWSGAWADIKQIVAGAIQIVQGTVREGLALLKGIASAAIKGFVDTFKGLPGLILSAVGDLSGVLVQAGKDVISGLIKGIGQATVGPLKSALAGVGDFIKDHKGPPSVDKVLLFPAGQQIMGGLIAGIDDSLPALQRQLSKVTAAVSPDVIGASTAGSAAGTTVIVQGDVGWNLGEFTQAVAQSQRDAATVANLRLALVG